MWKKLAVSGSVVLSFLAIITIIAVPFEVNIKMATTLQNLLIFAGFILAATVIIDVFFSSTFFKWPKKDWQTVYQRLFEKKGR